MFISKKVANNIAAAISESMQELLPSIDCDAQYAGNIVEDEYQIDSKGNTVRVGTYALCVHFSDVRLESYDANNWHIEYLPANLYLESGSKYFHLEEKPFSLQQAIRIVLKASSYGEHGFCADSNLLLREIESLNNYATA